MAAWFSIKCKLNNSLVLKRGNTSFVFCIVLFLFSFQKIEGKTFFSHAMWRRRQQHLKTQQKPRQKDEKSSFELGYFSCFHLSNCLCLRLINSEWFTFIIFHCSRSCLVLTQLCVRSFDVVHWCKSLCWVLRNLPLKSGSFKSNDSRICEYISITWKARDDDRVHTWKTICQTCTSIPSSSFHAWPSWLCQDLKKSSALQQPMKKWLHKLKNSHTCGGRPFQSSLPDYICNVFPMQKYTNQVKVPKTTENWKLIHFIILSVDMKSKSSRAEYYLLQAQ